MFVFSTKMVRATVFVPCLSCPLWYCMDYISVLIFITPLSTLHSSTLKRSTITICHSCQLRIQATITKWHHFISSQVNFSILRPQIKEVRWDKTTQRRCTVWVLESWVCQSFCLETYQEKKHWFKGEREWQSYELSFYPRTPSRFYLLPQIKNNIRLWEPWLWNELEILRGKKEIWVWNTDECELSDKS